MKKTEMTVRITAGMLACLMAAGSTSCGGSGLSASTKDLTKQYRGDGGTNGQMHTGDGGTNEQMHAEDGGTNEQIHTEDDGREDTGSGRETTGVTPEFAASYADFSLELLRNSKRQGQTAGSDASNAVVSPLSVLMALEMTRQGARGETRNEMDTVLYPGITAEEGKAALLTFSDNLPDEEGARMHLANSVWLNTENDVFTPDEDFLKTEAEEYDAQIFGAPFTEQTCTDLNRWVEHETDGMITDILDEIPKDALMYLVNAVAFEADWAAAYEANQVHDATFYGADGSEAAVSMMYEEMYSYLSGENVQGFRKPYKDGYSFVALLPDEGISLEEYLAGLDGETFMETITQENDTRVETGLPKFEVKTKLELSETLMDMGMPLAFDGDRADFTGMGSCADGYNMYISRVLHQTYVRVDELGTKAGAATVVEMCGESAMLMEEEPKRVILDRPFLYAIVEKESGLPVFIGTVEKL